MNVSRDYRDKRGGHDQRRWYVSIKPHRLREMYDIDRRITRRKAKQMLKENKEPPQRFKHERDYYD